MGLISFDSDEMRKKWVSEIDGGIIEADYIGSSMQFYDYEPHINDRWVISEQ